ncbi:hypothetical protein U1Q18_052037 [Sarracenia purpurea var. burkii]
MFPIEKPNTTSDVLASITFNVKATSDAHILLSSKPNPLINEPGYEIVLGSAGNAASEIRRGQKAENKTKVATANVISGDEWRGFWIRVKSDGIIMVGKEGDDWPIMFWQDPKPLPVKYYGFSSWTGVEASWEHQCPSENAQPLARIQKDAETPENCQDNIHLYLQLHPVLPNCPNQNQSEDNYVILTFYVKADSNAHILLSRTTKPTVKEPVYEIVLGSANNVASEIRKGQKTENREMKYMTNTVLHDEWRGYWIRVEPNGLIMVGTEGDDFPSYVAAKTCKTFYTQGFNYFPLLAVEKSNKKANVAFELTFDVKTDNLASVLLSTTSKPTDKELVYEIVLGQNNNTLSEIRRGQKADGRTMAVIVMTDIPPSNEWKKYWIQILNDGSILVGKL